MNMLSEEPECALCGASGRYEPNAWSSWEDDPDWLCERCYLEEKAKEILRIMIQDKEGK